jgi:aryl-alcohol dehydrogenase-like predicted oxidoreductase
MKLKVNKIILGTAGLGLKYGLKKNSKYLNKSKALKILEYAYDNGIKFFDTAKNYNTEDIIAEFLKTHGIKDLILSTKLPHNSNYKNILDNYLNSVNDTLKKTKLNRIETVFVHDLNDLKILRDKNHGNVLKILKKKLPINNIGFSIYNIKDFNKSVAIMKKSVFQFPFNVLNREFEKLESKKLIYARSIFLQGFLINKNIRFLNKKIDKLHKNYHNFIENLKIDPFDYAISSVLKKNYNYYVIGVDSIKELKKIINYKVKNNYDYNLDLIYSKKIIDPRNWR